MVEANVQIPAISISVQRMCGREIREVKVDGKSVELIADEEFLLLYALSFKKKKGKVQESRFSSLHRNEKYFTLTALDVGHLNR